MTIIIQLKAVAFKLKLVLVPLSMISIIDNTFIFTDE